jgi:hypothetical protein
MACYSSINESWYSTLSISTYSNFDDSPYMGLYELDEISMPFYSGEDREIRNDRREAIKKHKKS